MTMRTDLINKDKFSACKNIPELLCYLVTVLGPDIYDDKQELCNLISDCSRAIDTEKRLFSRAIKDDGISEKCLRISMLDSNSEQVVRLKQLITEFCNNNRYSANDGTDIVNAFAKAIGLTASDASAISLSNAPKGKKRIVIDTSVLLKRPAILDDLLVKFDQLIIPKIVLEEVNYQKDHGKSSQIKQKAWLVLCNIEKLPKNSVVFPETVSVHGQNDEKIVNIAQDIARNNQSDTIFVLANDILFSLLTRDISNLKMLKLEDFNREFSGRSQYNEKNTCEFIKAVKANSIDMVKRALYLPDIDINFIDPDNGWPPLIIAMRNRNIELVQLIIKHFKGVLDLNKQDKCKYQFTPIHHAVQLKRLDFIEVLYDAGADIDMGSGGKNAGNTPLMVSAWDGFVEGVRFFLDKGACTNQQDSNGFTALTKACIKGWYQVAKLLIDKTDLNIRSRENKKAYQYIEMSKPSGRDLMELFKNKYINL